jgi:hypothetical protein
MPGAKFFQQRDGFRCGHVVKMPRSNPLRQSLAGAISVTRMMMPEESVTIPHEISDDEDIDEKND